MIASAYLRVALTAAAAGLVLVSTADAGTPPSPRQQWLVESIIAYGTTNFDTASGLVKDLAGRPNVATASPGYVAAVLTADAPREQALTVLQAVLAHQDQAETSPTRGQFPWWAQASTTPSARATCLAVPVLAHIHRQWGPTLPGGIPAQLEAALHLALTALQRRGMSADDVPVLLRAASLVTLGVALDESAARAEGLEQVDRWVAELADEGLTAGHSPAADGQRIAALKWIWHSLGPEQRPASLAAALQLCYRDLAGRVQPGSGVLAGAALSTRPADYLTARGECRYLIYADLGGPQPAPVEPLGMFFTIPQYSLPDDLAADRDPHRPREVVTAARGEARVTRTDTYVHPLFSLGTLSARPALSSIPLLVTFASGGHRPTAYFFTQPQAHHISSIQSESVGLITANFDNIGTGDRRTALLYGVLGPRSQIEEVYLGTRLWNGQAAAVPELGHVVIKRLGCLLGFTTLRAGPAEMRQKVSGPLPGELRWSGQGPEAELELLIYGRKRSYALARPQHNMRAGVAVEIQPASAYASTADFAQYLAAVRVQQTVESTKELMAQPLGPHEEILRGSDPRSMAELAQMYERGLIHTIEYRTARATLRLREQMLRGAVSGRWIDGEELAEPGPWASDELLVPWGAGVGDFLARPQ